MVQRVDGRSTQRAATLVTNLYPKHYVLVSSVDTTRGLAENARRGEGLGTQKVRCAHDGERQGAASRCRREGALPARNSRGNIVPHV